MGWPEVREWLRPASRRWAAAAVVVAAFLLGGATFQDGTLFGPTVAAWVQALGSIAAIIAAAAFSTIDRRRRQLHHRQALATLVRDAAAMISGLWVLSRKHGVDADGLGPRNAKFLRNAERDLVSFPVMETGCPTVVGPLRNFIAYVDGAAAVGEKWSPTAFMSANEQQLGRISENSLPYIRRILVELRLGLGDIPPGDVAATWPNHDGIDLGEP